MLVLSRKRNESIIIGEGPTQITVVVVKVRGDKVRLGIEAPREIPVHRNEVLAAIEAKRSQESRVESQAPEGKEATP